MGNRSIRCLIFDCDGTLVDSEYLSHVGFTRALGENGIRMTPEESLARHRGGKLADMLQHAAGTAPVPPFDQFAARYYALLAQLFESQLQPMPGMQSVLAKLDLPMCVASNAPLAKTRHSLCLTGLDVYFGDKLFSAYEVERWKPDPALFLYAADRMGYAPQECAVIEDSPVGVEASLAAGMNTFHFTNDATEPPMAGAVQIKSMAELPALIA